MIPDLHKEQCCAACRWCMWEVPNAWAYTWAYFCGRAKQVTPVQPWNICPLYEDSDEWKDDPAPRSGPWVVSGI
jgi:hypothetical protein